MKRIFLAFPIALLLLSTPLYAQQTSTLIWDHPNSTPAQVATFQNVVTADGVVITAVPTCVAVGTTTTCSVAIPLITNGQHNYRVRSIINGIQYEGLSNITWPVTGGNQAPTAPRITILVTVTIGSF